MLIQPAPRISRLTLDADRVLTTGTITVSYIYIANSTASPVEVVFLDNDAVPILNMVVKAQSSDRFEGAWIVDNGLNISGVSDVDVVVSILHTSEGS